MSGETSRDVGTVAEPHAVVTEADLAAPPETVWRALTTPEILAEWLGPNDLPAAAPAGSRFGVEAPGEPGGRIACEVLEVVPHERLALGWTIAAPDTPRPRDTVVEFELAPLLNGGTRLRIVHREADARGREQPVTQAGDTPLGRATASPREGRRMSRLGRARTHPARAAIRMIRRAA